MGTLGFGASVRKKRKYCIVNRYKKTDAIAPVFLYLGSSRVPRQRMPCAMHFPMHVGPRRQTSVAHRSYKLSLSYILSRAYGNAPVVKVGIKRVRTVGVAYCNIISIPAILPPVVYSYSNCSTCGSIYRSSWLICDIYTAFQVQSLGYSSVGRHYKVTVQIRQR